MTSTLATAQLFSAEDLTILRNGLSALGAAHPDRSEEIEHLNNRLASMSPARITVGVYGGVVQWVRGNPVPIRVIDYDGEPGDWPDKDEEGHPCTIWEVPPETDQAGRDA